MLTGKFYKQKQRHKLPKFDDKIKKKVSLKL